MLTPRRDRLYPVGYPEVEEQEKIYTSLEEIEKLDEATRDKIQQEELNKANARGYAREVALAKTAKSMGMCHRIQIKGNGGAWSTPR